MRLLLILGTMLCFSGIASAESQRTIAVTGQGQAFAEPDMATISLGIEERGKLAGAVMQAASDKTRTIIETLDRFGIDARDVQTSNLSLQPNYERMNNTQQSKLVGYTAFNILTVRVRELDNLGDVLGAVLGDGANRLNNLSFSVQDPAPLLEIARKAAVADALARAETYAGAANLTLGPVQSINEMGRGGAPRPEMMMMDARAASVPVAAGEVSYSASINMVITIAD